MKTELDNQIRALVDGVEPVTASEAIARSKSPSLNGRHLDPIDTRPLRKVVSHLPVGAIAASVLVLVGGLAFWMSNDRGGSNPNSNFGAPGIVSANEISDIRAQSASLASSGTAEVITTTHDVNLALSAKAGRVLMLPRDRRGNGLYYTRDYVYGSVSSLAITFSGANYDLMGHAKNYGQAGPFGAAPGSTTSSHQRVVNGNMYIFGNYVHGVGSWVDVGSPNSSGYSLPFPDPITLYNKFNVRAKFELLGTTTSGGVTIAHLKATDPAAIGSKSYQIWVNQQDVVQKLTFTSAGTDGDACPFAIGTGTLTTQQLTQLKKAGYTAVGTETFQLKHGPCPMNTYASSTTVTFGNLGSSEHIDVPTTFGPSPIK